MKRFPVVLILLATSACASSPAPPERATSAPAPAPPAATAPAAATAPQREVRDVDALTAARWLKEHPDTVVLDVRTPDEYADGHIEGARLLDFQSDDFAAKLGELDKTKTYLVHCAVGGRSSRARDLMAKEGFDRVLHLEGGIQAWIESGRPVTKE